MMSTEEEITASSSIRQRKMSDKTYDFINIPAKISKSVNFMPNEPVLVMIINGDLVIKRIVKPSIIPKKTSKEVPVKAKTEVKPENSKQNDYSNLQL